MMQCALSCDVTTVELYCTDLMQIANDLINIANSIVPHVEDSGKLCYCLYILLKFVVICSYLYLLFIEYLHYDFTYFVSLAGCKL